MKRIQTITSKEMRGINRTAILEMIRQDGPMARSMISRELNVSLPTVMRVIDELVEERLVRELDQTEWSGGRRRTLLELNTEEHLAIGLDLGGTKLYGAVTNLGGEILFEEEIPQHGTVGEESFELIVALINQLKSRVQPNDHSLMGLGVGVPGVTYPEAGVIEWAPSLGWRDFPLLDRLKEHFDLPIIIDNDVNLSALGEVWFGAGRDAHNFVLINIGTGIGAGIVIDGALYRGARQMAGEIGYMVPGREYLDEDYPGFGALEMLTAGGGIMRRGNASYKEKKLTDLAQPLTSEDVFDAHRGGETWAAEVLEETIDYLAIMIAAVSTFFDPDLITLGGGVGRSADLLIGPITRRLTGRIPHVPPIVASKLGFRAAALGAMVNLLHNVSDFYVVRKLS
jgi:predicted NBD/HSP70 family sugar kinase